MELETTMENGIDMNDIKKVAITPEDLEADSDQEIPAYLNIPMRVAVELLDDVSHYKLVNLYIELLESYNELLETSKYQDWRVKTLKEESRTRSEDSADRQKDYMLAQEAYMNDICENLEAENAELALQASMAKDEIARLYTIVYPDESNIPILNYLDEDAATPYEIESYNVLRSLMLGE